jgi:hypothetical protein
VSNKTKTTPETKPLAPDMPEPIAESRRPVMVGGVRRRKLFNLPGNVGSAPKRHAEGTKRALVVRLLTRAEGATFLEVQEAIAGAFPGGAWDDRTCTEGIRLISTALGYRLEEDPQSAVIRAFSNAEIPPSRYSQGD